MAGKDDRDYAFGRELEALSTTIKLEGKHTREAIQALAQQQDEHGKKLTALAQTVDGWPSVCSVNHSALADEIADARQEELEAFRLSLRGPPRVLADSGAGFQLVHAGPPPEAHSASARVGLVSGGLVAGLLISVLGPRAWPIVQWLLQLMGGS